MALEELTDADQNSSANDGQPSSGGVRVRDPPPPWESAGDRFRKRRANDSDDNRAAKLPCYATKDTLPDSACFITEKSIDEMLREDTPQVDVLEASIPTYSSPYGPVLTAATVTPFAPSPLCQVQTQSSSPAPVNSAKQVATDSEPTNPEPPKDSATIIMAKKVATLQDELMEKDFMYAGLLHRNEQLKKNAEKANLELATSRSVNVTLMSDINKLKEELAAERVRNNDEAARKLVQLRAALTALGSGMEMKDAVNKAGRAGAIEID